MREDWKQMIMAWNKVTIWGTLPLVLAIIIFLSALLMRVFNWGVESPLDEICTKKKKNKAEKIYMKYDAITEIYLWICIMLAGLPFLLILNAKFENYIYGMMQNIDTVSSIIIGLTAIVTTMAVVIVAFDKKYYLVFSIKDVLQKYKFTKWLSVVIVSCLLVSITTMTLLDEKIETYFDAIRFIVLEIATIYNIIGAMYILAIIICIVFSDRKNELSLLGQLYRRFWMHRIDLLQFKEKNGWSEEAVEINIDYLMETFIDACKHKKVKNVKAIEFVTTLGCCKEKWYAVARKRFNSLMIIFLSISVLINYLVLKEESNEIILIDIMVSIITIIYSYKGGSCVQLIILRLYLDTWGYYIVSDNGEEKIIPRVKLIKRGIYNYLIKMNSLNAFFYIWLKYINPSQNERKNRFNEVLVWLDTLDKKDMITYFPAFTIGYFLYSEGTKVENIKDIYLKIVQEEDKYNFTRMLHSQIFYLTKNFYSEVYGYRKKLNEYLHWLQS